MADLEIFKARLHGKAPIMLHNGQLANPRSEAAKALSAVSKGRAKDHDKLARAEFMGSLYLDANVEPCIPVDNVLSTICEGAAAFKKRKQARAGIYDLPEHPTFPLLYKGPRDPVKLYESDAHVDTRGVRVQQSRIMRTRPIFRGWQLVMIVEYDPELMPLDDLRLALARAGKAIGLGDYRPRYGRFSYEELRS